ncbi:hypothetical protein [Acinetobacter baumannii]|uniref:hypothetical protein n=1 Tax=Acinetobacter baumannii TaxID=470 RepID=UPI0038916B3D
MKRNTGKPYEHFVQTLYQAILAAEFTGFGGQKNIKVETNKILTGKNGIKREFDIYWEFTQGGFIYKKALLHKAFEGKVFLSC